MNNLITIKKNDRLANLLIIIVSIIVFVAVAVLSRVKLDVSPGFDPHVFALINAVINSIVFLLLIGGLLAVKQKKFALHQRIMLTAMTLSVLFLVSYICHHLLTGDTKFGDLNLDGMVDDVEKAKAGSLRLFYYLILLTHIPLAGIILPFILFTAYRGLVTEYPRHKKLARITFPVWLYVSLTGVLVYILISPYYG